MRNGSKRPEAPGDPLLEVSNEELFFRSEVEPECFTELVRRHKGKWRGFATRVAGRQLAGDVVQVALLRMVRFRHQFLNYAGTSFLAWAGTILKNVAVEQAIAQAQYVATEEDILETLIGTSLSCEEDWVTKQLVTLLLAALEPERRAVVWSRYFDELEYDEIATKFAIPVGTVKSRIFRAHRQMAKMLPSLSDAPQ